MASPVLHVVIDVEGERYALDASQVLEIIPLVRLRTLPGAPSGTAGLMTFRGVPVPVVDLSLIACGRATAATGAARIVVVEHAPAPRLGVHQLLGLLVPSARDAVRLDPDAFVDGGLVADGVPALGRVLASPEGMLQRVHATALLTPELREALQRAADAA
ncbi:MAG: chemotaxis protein CheW [Gemmatimonadetes bacterium]|jgi:chemotaxis-related protein WspB|nr:chemotaxis protein CheW [Gemmatimonadota bacterium]